MFIEVTRRQEALLTGWRWLQDIDSDVGSEVALDQLYAAVEKYGPFKVAVGDGYEQELALFVYDVFDLQLALREDLLNFECGHVILQS